MAFAGQLRLRAERGGREGTFLAEGACSGPFHVGKPHWQEGIMRVQVVNPTAGMLAGDAMTVDISVAAGARLAVTTPAAARAFRMAEGARASLRQRLRCAAGAWLEYAPDPLYPHAGTEFSQDTLLEVEPGGAACLVDSLAPGRSARGELWAWRRLENTLTVEQGGRPLLRERLDVGGAQFGRLAAFHGFSEAWIATLVAVAPELAARGAALGLNQSMTGEEGALAGATCPAPDLLVVRVVAPSGHALRASLAGIRERLAVCLPAIAEPSRTGRQ